MTKEEAEAQKKKKKPSLADVAPELAKDVGVSAGVNALKNPSSLPAGMQIANASSGMPMNAVASQALPDGSAGFLMTDGSVVPASEFTLGNLAGAAGVVAGGYGAYEGIKDKNPVGAGLGGATAGLGLNALGYSLGPAGWAAMLAIPAGAALFNKLGDKDRFKDEYKRAEKLREKGINWNLNTIEPSRGRSTEELINPNAPRGFVGTADNGQFINNRFAESRKETDLTGKDIWGYSAFGELYNDWLSGYSGDAREKIANKALELGLVDEHHGTIDIKKSDELNNFATSLKGVAPEATPTQPKTNVATPVPKAAPKPNPIMTQNNLPAPIEPPTMPEPDDEPSQEELDQVSGYSKMLDSFLKKTKGQYGSQSNQGFNF